MDATSIVDNVSSDQQHQQSKTQTNFNVSYNVSHYNMLYPQFKGQSMPNALRNVTPVQLPKRHQLMQNNGQIGNYQYLNKYGMIERQRIAAEKHLRRFSKDHDKYNSSVDQYTDRSGNHGQNRQSSDRNAGNELVKKQSKEHRFSLKRQFNEF